MVSDESGFTHYASEMVRTWDGRWVHKDEWEPRHPQDFVRAKNDPVSLQIVRPNQTVSAVPTSAESIVGLLTVGETGIQTVYGPATHIFDPDDLWHQLLSPIGIGDMEIGTTFIVS